VTCAAFLAPTGPAGPQPTDGPRRPRPAVSGGTPQDRPGPDAARPSADAVPHLPQLAADPRATWCRFSNWMSGHVP
jgi:hypothetical protein